MKKPHPKTRFWAKVTVSSDRDGCMLWTGSTAQGYGRFRFRGRLVRAHRFSYELNVGPIPDGHQIDHLCRNPACVRPDHLEPVTQHENVMRGNAPSARNAKATQCVNGHPFSEENTYLNGARRVCRECARRFRREYKARHRAARLKEESE